LISANPLARERALQRPTTQLEVSRPSPHRSETSSRKIWDFIKIYNFSYFSSYFRPLFWSFVVVVGHQVEAHEGDQEIAGSGVVSERAQGADY